jgi:hypothetical protein
MASSSKRKTTMAKLNRERRLREKRAEKAARKVARKQEAERVAESPEGYSSIAEAEDPATGPDVDAVARELDDSSGPAEADRQ